LGNVLIVDLDIAFSGIGQVLSRIKAGGGQGRGDVPVKAFDHAVSSGGPGCDQAMFEVCVGTDLDAGRLALACGA